MLTSTNRRFFSLLAACLLLIVLVFAAQAEPVTARALPADAQQAGGEGTFVYLPLISNVPPNTISGRVTLAGNAAPGISLTLELFDRNYGWQGVLQETTTGADGSYQFKNVPEIGNDRFYIVWYENGVGDNHFDASCLSFWAQPIDSISAVDENFDISDVEMDPIFGEMRFPITFTWRARPVATDHYQFALYGEGFAPFGYGSAPFYISIMNEIDGKNTSYELRNIPGNFNYGEKYYWGVWINYDVVGHGFGLSLAFSEGIIFTETGGSSSSLGKVQSLVHKFPVAVDHNVLPLP